MRACVDFVHTPGAAAGLHRFRSRLYSRMMGCLSDYSPLASTHLSYPMHGVQSCLLFALAVAGFISIVRCPKHPSQDPEPAANTKSLSSRRSSSRTRSRKLEFLVLLIRDIAARALGNDGRWLSLSLMPPSVLNSSRRLLFSCLARPLSSNRWILSCSARN